LVPLTISGERTVRLASAAGLILEGERLL